MSTADPPVAVTATGVGLGYGIAIAVSILVLISTIMLASYACVKVKSRDRSYHDSDSNISRRRHQSSSGTPEVVVVVGLDGPVIESYPKVILGESKRLPRPSDGSCAICLSDYRPKDTVRCIPECNHCFHAGCVDEWLRMSATCPLCRNSPAPSPVSTPLSQLVPLAFHARYTEIYESRFTSTPHGANPPLLTTEFKFDQTPHGEKCPLHGIKRRLSTILSGSP